MIVNSQSGTRLDEVADGIYRISTPFSAVPGGFSFNQYLVIDEEPLLFHTGLKRIYPYVREAIGRMSAYNGVGGTYSFRPDGELQTRAAVGVFRAAGVRWLSLP